MTYDRDLAFNGATLFCSGHAPIVTLMDLEGAILHSWKISFKKVWPNSLPYPVDKEHKEFIRRAYLYPNGDILAVFEYIGLVKLDRDSGIIWRYAGRNHHDIYVAKNGDIYALGYKQRNLRKEFPHIRREGDEINDDLVIILNPEGKEVKQFSVFDAFYHSDYAGYLNFIRKEDPEVFHTNSIQLIEQVPSRLARVFSPGDILVSMRNINTIAVIDGRKETVKWALTGKWRWQHQAVFLESGNILLFDNQGANTDSYFEFNRSRVMEIDPLTQQIIWEYRRDGEGEDFFFSRWLGYNQRLPNGNTLITESTQGRIFEVTPQKEVVWDYFNPHRTGKDNELIATIMGARRIEPGKMEFLNRGQ